MAWAETFSYTCKDVSKAEIRSPAVPHVKPGCKRTKLDHPWTGCTLVYWAHFPLRLWEQVHLGHHGSVYEVGRCIPIPDQGAETMVTTLVYDFISHFGAPLELHIVQGRNFESALFKNVCQLL